MNIVCGGCGGTGTEMKLRQAVAGFGMWIRQKCKPCQGTGKLVWRNTMR